MEFMLDKNQVLEQFRIPDFVLKTQKQIHKDFSVQGLTINDLLLEKELDYNEIFSIVADAIRDVLHIGERQLLQLNYHIDLPQSQFLSAITGKNPVTDLAALIIRREAYKVFLRTKF